jgi:PAS domain-containing protein
MWTLRVLKGPQVGQTFQLNNGPNLIGRAPHCNVVLQSNGVSKEHARIDVTDQGLVIFDLESSNGTFVNGLQIRRCPIADGDKLGFFNILIDLTEVPEIAASPGAPQDIPMNGTGAAPVGGLPPSAPQEPLSLAGRIDNYIETVVMPGIYKLAEVSEFRWVLGMFVLAFVLMVTVLSVVPLVTIYKTNIENEIKDKVESYAEELTNRYIRAVRQNATSVFDVRFLTKRKGVVAALVVSSVDGTILAPATNVGAYADLPFVHKARKDNYDKQAIEIIANDLVASSVPIRVFQAEKGEASTIAHSIVIYDMGSLQLDQGQVISLFIRVLVIAIFIGFILFYLMWRLIEYPIKNLNTQVDKALKEGTDHTEVEFQFPALQQLIMNVNTALSRALRAGDGGPNQVAQDRGAEAANIIQLISDPAIAIDSSETIVFINSAFEELVGVRLASIEGQSIDALPDQALQLSIRDLLSKNNDQPHLIASNDIDFSGLTYTADSQAIMGSSAIEYYLIVFQSGSGGEVAYDG